MNKYILWGAGALVLLVGFIFLTGETRKESTSTTPPSSSSERTSTTGASTTTPTVIFTNNGFIPEELTIKLGTTVTFINQSDANMWIASAPHPTHTLYPEFDEKASVTKGGSYSFTFNKTGTHPYHNHLLLGKYGKIIVE